MNGIPPEDLQICLDVLQRVANDPGAASAHDRFKALVAKIHREGRRLERRTGRELRVQHDRELRAGTAMMRRKRRVAAENAAPEVPGTGVPGTEVPGTRHPEATEIAGTGVPGTRHPGATELPGTQVPGTPAPGPRHPGPAMLLRERPCYICKQPYRELDPFYHLLCPPCAASNARMRDVRADLRGRTALVTGGRVKIGHELALRMLRDGARVVITTRFAIDAAQRFAAAADFDVWRDRLRIHRLDLRHLPAVETFVRELSADEPFLDILINNAAQTVRRPPGFYRHLLDQERHPPAALLDAARPLLAGACEMPPAGDDSTSLAAIRTGASDAVPAGGRAIEELEWDRRATNSWTLRTEEVDPIELVEVQLVGAMAPFLLCSRLRPLLARSPAARRFIVNVSAMEGQFARAGKTVFHPHTNMAKAALNMLTRTSAADYATDAIYMNSVDTGWITDENPLPKRTRIEERDGFVPPLDVVDGAARVYHPIALGISAESPLYGLFLKDYRPYSW